MKILYISYDGMTDPLGQSQVIPYLIGLSKIGHQVAIISCEKKERYVKQRAFIQDLLEKNNINWQPVPYSTLPSIISKFMNLRRIKKKSRQLLQKNKPQLIHCRSYMAALIGLSLKSRYGIKFLFDMRGFWADERMDGKIWNPKNLIQQQLYQFFKKKEIEFLKNADYTISLTENAKKEILAWKEFKNAPIPIEVIPCCVDLEHFSEKEIKQENVNKLRSQLKMDTSDFIISYLGSIGTWYMLEEMLDFFKVLSANKKNAKFLFITQDDEQEILSIAKSKGIDKEKIIVKSASRDQVPLYLSLSQLSIYFIKPLFSKKASSPTKTGEIMAMGIPIISNSGIGDCDQIIKEAGAGMLVESFSEEEYLRIIEQIDVLLSIEKSSIQNAARKYFSLENGVKLYHAIYQKINPEIAKKHQ